MSTVFDLGLLKEFSFIFSMVLIFSVSFGLLQIVDIFKSRGINALAAISMAILLGITSNASEVIEGMAPWFVITGFFVVFLLVLVKFAGVNIGDTMLGGNSGLWWIFVPLAIGLVVSLVSGGALQRSDADEDPTPGQAVIEIVTEPKVLGFFLILVISAITVALMAAVPKVAS